MTPGVRYIPSPDRQRRTRLQADLVRTINRFEGPGKLDAIIAHQGQEPEAGLDRPGLRVAFDLLDQQIGCIPAVSSDRSDCNRSAESAAILFQVLTVNHSLVIAA